MEGEVEEGETWTVEEKVVEEAKGLQEAEEKEKEDIEEKCDKIEVKKVEKVVKEEEE